MTLGPRRVNEVVLCEGYATGLSIDKALRVMRLPITVLICFNDSNMKLIASKLKGVKAYVFADHDPPQRDPVKALINPGEAGQRAAIATGLPWVMSPVEGEDANDLYKRAGVMEVTKLLFEARRLKDQAA